jgi:hypothetical protein
VAANVRDLDNAYDQYLAFKETRAAALDNLKVQIEQFRARRNIYLNVLQALNDWGNSVSAEAQALISYNVLLATLERQTGTILETNGLFFNEERFKAAGPLGVCKRLYPAAVTADGKPTRYPGTKEPGENAFDLKKPDVPRSGPDTMEPTLPPPRPLKDEPVLPPPRPLKDEPMLPPPPEQVLPPPQVLPPIQEK